MVDQLSVMYYVICDKNLSPGFGLTAVHEVVQPASALREFSQGKHKHMWPRTRASCQEKDGPVSGPLCEGVSADINLVVQGAYKGVSRDFKTLSVSQGGWESQREGELRNKSELNAWGDEAPSPRPPDFGSDEAGTLSANPWAITVRARPALSTSNFLETRCSRQSVAKLQLLSFPPWPSAPSIR